MGHFARKGFSSNDPCKHVKSRRLVLDRQPWLTYIYILKMLLVEVADQTQSGSLP